MLGFDYVLSHAEGQSRPGKRKLTCSRASGTSSGGEGDPGDLLQGGWEVEASPRRRSPPTTEPSDGWVWRRLKGARRPALFRSRGHGGCGCGSVRSWDHAPRRADLSSGGDETALLLEPRTRTTTRWFRLRTCRPPSASDATHDGMKPSRVWGWGEGAEVSRGLQARRANPGTSGNGKIWWFYSIITRWKLEQDLFFLAIAGY